MEITAAQVKALREKTGAGMMDCKAALVETAGDMEQAVDLLRKKGMAQAAKRAGRSTSEGVIGSYLSPDATTGVLVELNCETDFVAKNESFQAMARDLAGTLATASNATPALLTDPSGPVQPVVTAAIAKIGENMSVPRFVKYEGGGVIGQYIHLGGKIGVMVEFAGTTPEVAARDEFRSLVKEIAMQIAAASPQFAARGEVPAAMLTREKDIYRGQMEGSGKPANVIEKIVEGKLGAFYEQVVLVDQPSIRDPKMKVSDVVAAANKALGTNVSIARFVRLRVGEQG